VSARRAFGIAILACASSIAISACGAKTGLRVGERSAGGSAGVANDAGTSSTPQARADKIDLLFMIDGSGSMGDKQQILALALPDLVRRLTNPRCVAPDGTPAATQPTRPTAPCSEGFEREFNPVQDMHIGVISSNLGSHGAAGGCLLGQNEDDGGHLVTRGTRTYRSLGFLAWDPARTKEPPGETDPNVLEDQVRRLVTGVGELGCAYEASLEAWYRFLIDPEPYQRLGFENCADNPRERCVVPQGVDQTLLAQRSNFLRQDSLVAIVMLSDENDCSIIDGGRSFRVLESGQMPRATSVCASDPNSPCCQPCDAAQRDGCPALASDPACREGPYPPDLDSQFLRCFAQKRRFGEDFLYPVERYIQGLTRPNVRRRDGTLVMNPLFVPDDPAAPPRDPSLVFLAAIVGVPWQDVARNPGDPEKLEYKTASELHAGDVWSVILGDPKNAILPTDPLMIESIEERTGMNPITGDELAPSSASSPTQNPINGHEMRLSYSGIDLQYACIFELPQPRDCSSLGPYCDCGSGASGDSKPICQDNRGNYGAIQFRAKAYPGLRQLEVLKGFGNNAIVASICARNVTDSTRQDFGYRPALGAILDRLSAGLL